ncbi:MAG: hypothetical protein JWQ07_1511 [Ramlibacter sp.]|nr:hypothetical protein [Ramlibacter sp.]
MKQLPIGIAAANIAHTVDGFDVDTKFRMVREAGAFDYIDKTPLPGELELYQRASQTYGIPVRAGGFSYVLGRDEPLLEWHLRIASELGSDAHNIKIMTHDVHGALVSNEQVARAFVWAAELGERHGVAPCLETHVNTWSEHFGRVAAVGELVERRGVEFNLTLDHSHVIFKIDNPSEQEVQGLRKDVVSGRLQLDPFHEDDVCTEWIERNWVRHAHARSAAPANPVNIWARHPDGTPGRGIEYPFARPEPGEWHSEWAQDRLEPWKEVVRRLLRFHASRADSRLGQISTEFLPFIDYAGGAKYSVFEQAIACSRWLRQQWQSAQQAAPALGLTVQ